MMTLPQIYALSIIAGVVIVMLWGRLRYEIVAGIALVIAVIAGVVPVKDAFKGFSDDIVIIIASALIVSAAISRAGIFEAGLRFISPYARSTQAQVIVLVFAVGVMSAIVKNIGALAMMLPIAAQFARNSGKSVSVFLMPMAFASLLGGIVTLIGTSPNIIVSRVRAELTGTPYSMFDFTYVGIWIALAGMAFLCVGYRLLPRDRKGSASLKDAIAVNQYMTEARVAEASLMPGKTISELMSKAEAGVKLLALVRKKKNVTLLPDMRLRTDDILLFEGEHAALDRLIKETHLVLEGDDRPTELSDHVEEIIAIEAVVSPQSQLIGSDARLSDLHARYGVNLLAVNRSGSRLNQRIRDIRLQMGDVVVLQGAENTLPLRLTELGLLPLAERTIKLGDKRSGWIAALVLAATIIVLTTGLVPVSMAFFTCAGLMIVLGALPAREAYAAVDWPIIVMLAALIPVSDALSTTGATDLLAAGLTAIGKDLPAWGAIALVLIGSMAVTPFLNNAATVLVVAPIGATFAKNLGYNPDPFLMAVAIGAACDFLTPIGHQCNTLVMGPGGYKFSDYPRLGAPLSLLVIIMAVPLIMIFWPLRN